MNEVSKQNPCPSCGKPDWCAWLPDGKRLRWIRLDSDVPDRMHEIRQDNDGNMIRGFANLQKMRQANKKYMPVNEINIANFRSTAWDYCSQEGDRNASL